MRVTMILCFGLSSLLGASAQQALLDETFRDNSAGWVLHASGYGRPVAEIAEGRLSLRPDSGGGETSVASAALEIPVPHTNLDVSFSLHATDGQFWSHRVTFELLDGHGMALGTVGIASELSAQPGVRVQGDSRRFVSLIRDHAELAAGPRDFSLNFHELKVAGQLPSLDERQVRRLRITFQEDWMGRLEVRALRIVAGPPPTPLGPAALTSPREPMVTVPSAGCDLTVLADRPAWVSLRNTASGDEYLKNRAAPSVPLLVNVGARRLLGDDFAWTPCPQSPRGPAWTGLREDAGLRLRVTLSPGSRIPGTLLWLVEAQNIGSEAQDVTVWPLYMDGVLQVGKAAGAQRVVMPTWIGFNGSIRDYAAGCSGNRIYPQNLSMQYMALTSTDTDAGLAVWVRDPRSRYKVMDIGVNEVLETTLQVGFEPTRLMPRKWWVSPPIVLEVSGASWYGSARHYAEWCRSNLRSRQSPDWVHRAGQIFHHCTGYSEQHVPLAEHLPAMYRRFQQAARKLPTPMTFDLGEVPDAKRGGAAGEAAGLAAMRAQFGARSLIYMPAITEYDDLPVSHEMTDWYILQPDGTMLPAWLKNATFCPGYGPVTEYRARQLTTRITERAADGVYVDESLAQGYHTCYNPLHAHPTPYDWGRSQRRLWKALRAAADRRGPEVGLITEGCCDVVVDYADGFMAWPSGAGDGIAPMRVAFPERAYFSNGPATPAGVNAKAALGLQFVNGIGAWFVNQPPPADLADWTASLADWREKLAEFLVGGKVLCDPVTGPMNGDARVVARAYSAGGQVLVAATNIGSAPWSGSIGMPRGGDWPTHLRGARELVTDRPVPVTEGRFGLSLQPGQIALVRMAAERGATPSPSVRLP